MDAKISALKAEYSRLAEKHESVGTHMRCIQQKIDRLRKQRDDAEYKLTPREENEFRRALTIVGQMLEKDTLSGGLEILDEEPEIMDETQVKRKYSIDIKSYFELRPCPGLYIKVQIKTKHPYIKRIIREMVEQDGHVLDDYVRDSMTGYFIKKNKLHETTSWIIDWDYHYTIKIKNPVSEEQYFAGNR